MGKVIKVLTKYKTKADIPEAVKQRYRGRITESKNGVIIRAYVSSKRETALQEQQKFQELTGQKVNFIGAREQARKTATRYSDKIKAESKAAVEKAQAKAKTQKQEKLYKTISERMEAKRKAKEIKKPTSTAAPTTGTIQRQKQTTARKRGAAYSTLTPEQERDYGVITQKQYEKKIRRPSELKQASKIYEKAKFFEGDFVAKGLEKSTIAIRRGEIERQKGIERQSELVKATKMFSVGSFAERVAIGLYTAPVDLPVAVGEAITKQATTTVASLKYPSIYKDIQREQRRAFKEGTVETLKDPETYAEAAIFAAVPSLKAPRPKPRTPRTKAKPKTKPSLFEEIRKSKTTSGKAKGKPTKKIFKTEPEKQFFKDIRIKRDPITGKKTATAKGEITGARQTLTRSQLRETLRGKKAQARSPFGRIDDIITKRRKDRIKKPKRETKDIIKTEKEIVKFKEPKRKSKDIIISRTKISKTKKKTKDTDIIKAKDTFPKPKPSKDIIKTPSKDIVPKPKPSKDIIKTPSKDIVPKPKPSKTVRPKRETLREKAEAKRRSTPFALPKFDVDLGGSGGSGLFGRRGKRVTGRKTGYKASLVAETLGIYGKAPTTKQFTGYEFRPLLEEDKKKKKNKRGKIY